MHTFCLIFTICSMHILNKPKPFLKSIVARKGTLSLLTRCITRIVKKKLYLSKMNLLGPLDTNKQWRCNFKLWMIDAIWKLWSQINIHIYSSPMNKVGIFLVWWFKYNLVALDQFVHQTKMEFWCEAFWKLTSITLGITRIFLSILCLSFLNDFFSKCMKFNGAFD